jgi:hypothetical protein
MAMTAAGMVAKIKAAQPAPSQTNDPAAAAAAADAYLLALCQGVIDEIKANMIVTSSGADPQGGSVTSTSTGIV